MLVQHVRLPVPLLHLDILNVVQAGALARGQAGGGAVRKHLGGREGVGQRHAVASGQLHACQIWDCLSSINYASTISAASAGAI